jgi:hypothetical protein
MNILFGHYVADEGSIEAFGQPLAKGQPSAALEAGIGMVHQHFTLAEKRDDLAAPHVEADGIIGEQRSEPLGDAIEPEDDLAVLGGFLTVGGWHL